MNLYFLDKVKDDLDFWGINYYGEEHIENASLSLSTDSEYSESGRRVNPSGLNEVLTQLKARYWPSSKSPSIIITENGISDSSDILRPSYIIEHLMAVQAAIASGFQIDGYILWTISDNWEWADGYCPKFGVVAVDRSSPNLQRKKRPSYEMYQSIVKGNVITQVMRSAAWEQVQKNIGTLRPFCRSNDGKTGLDQPAQRPISNANWQHPWRLRAH
jgi:beta-glucosidase/6-phospho-beta-glucosidase/beta-galactosidase